MLRDSLLALLPASPHKHPSYVENNSNKNGKTTPEPPLQDPSSAFLCFFLQATSKAWINRTGHEKTSKPPTPLTTRGTESSTCSTEQHGAAHPAQSSTEQHIQHRAAHPARRRRNHEQSSAPSTRGPPAPAGTQSPAPCRPAGTRSSPPRSTAMRRSCSASGSLRTPNFTPLPFGPPQGSAHGSAHHSRQLNAMQHGANPDKPVPFWALW